jgi:hypothetical protein
MGDVERSALTSMNAADLAGFRAVAKALSDVAT